ncbi:MAG TPA: protein kinase [Gemmatimonadaceae bacterium]|jgi:serine/threonine-protein kinase|nr:protein kinase [Gemmatimonadaceae bacterium]
MTGVIGETAIRLGAALADRYRIERELGAGGMATVYLAHDLKHERQVAIKTLKPELAAVLGAERFIVEIKTTAALQHPHILPLFDSGEADGFLYYVMPYIQGETIREKVNRETQFGVDEAVRIAREIADALDYAHRHGVIHRDIKPENILLHDGRAMVMDFGIALAVSAAAGGRMTETGLSLGTPHYMSPEQATAEKEISARSDIYSLASVLYEMLTGNPPHTGASAQQIIMKIITEPAQPVTSLRRSVPANVAAAIDKALEKLPADRFATANEFAAALNNPAFRSDTAPSAPGAGPTRRTSLLLAGACVVLALAAGVAGARWMPGRAIGGPVVKFTLASNPALKIRGDFTHPFAVSRDGAAVVFTADTGDGDHLWVRTLDDVSPRKLDATRSGHQASISPDGQWVAFVLSNHIIRKVKLSGGEATTILTLDGITASLDWASNDEIVFEALGSGIRRIDANGGTPRPLTPVDSAAGETGHRRPLVLGEQRLVLFTSLGARRASQLGVYSLKSGRRAQLDVQGAQALGIIDDELIYTRDDGALMAVPFDARDMRTRGAPRQLPERVAATQFGTPSALSPNGTLVYQVAAPHLSRLVLDDGSRLTTPLGERPRVFHQPRFSPDGRSIAVVIGEGGEATNDVWVMNRASSELTRITRVGGAKLIDWSQDGRTVVFLRGDSLWEQPVGTGAGPHPLDSSALGVSDASVVPGGRSIIVQGRRSQLLAESLNGSGKADTIVPPFVNSNQLRAFEPRVSPDGRWVAFTDRNGQQVYVSSLAANSTVQISDAGGRLPVWGRDAGHLYYHTTATPPALVFVELRTAPNLEVVRRQRLADRQHGAELSDVARDGSLLMLVPLDEGPEVRVVSNWSSAVRRGRRGMPTP